MNNHQPIVLFLLMIIVLFSSCESEELDADIMLPKANRELGKLLVVVNKNYWEGPIDDLLNEEFGQFILTTPGPWDQEFDIKYLDPKGFNGQTNTDNTILFLEIDENSKNSSLPYIPPIRDRYAKNQLIFNIPSMTEEDLLFYLERYTDTIKKTIQSEYLLKLTSRLQNDTEINSLLSKKHQLSLSTPPGMKILNSNPEFTMLGKTTIKKDDNGDHEIQKRVFIYSYPYNDQALFTQKEQISIRDSVCKKNVKGRVPNSFMTTAKDQYRPLASKSLINKNNYILETRGSWRVINDRMGGAFISIAIHDPSQNRIVTIEGNVYAPNFSKRELIREMESIIYSYKFIPQ